MTPPASRYLKAHCQCGYTVRIVKKWAKAAWPVCPLHGPLSVEGLDRPERVHETPAPGRSEGNAAWWAKRWLDKATVEEKLVMRALLENESCLQN